VVTAAFTTLLLVIAGCFWVLWDQPVEGVGLPLIAVATFTFVYVAEPAYLMWTDQLRYFLTDDMTTKALLLPAAALVCFMWGWHVAARRRNRIAARIKPITVSSAARLYEYGLFTACIGSVLYLVIVKRSGGFLHAYGEMHGHGFDWAHNTAYLYMSPFWVQSGLAMMVISSNRIKMTAWHGAAIAFFALTYTINGVLLGSRHDVFAIGAILWASWSLARHTRPTVARAVVPLAIASLGALLALGYRETLHLGDNKPSAPSLVDALTMGLANDDVSLRYQTSGVEFVAHSAILDTVDKTRKYHLGINWLYYYTIHLIPRIWWPNKPYRFDTPGITKDDVLQVTGIELANGYASAIVADLYSQFGYFSLLFFVGLGWCARWLLLRAELGSSALAMCGYATLFSLSLNLFGQGFDAILVPAAYALLPVGIYHVLEGRRARYLAIGRLPQQHFRVAG
jgi:hypothetical protein